MRLNLGRMLHTEWHKRHLKDNLDTGASTPIATYYNPGSLQLSQYTTPLSGTVDLIVQGLI